MSADPAERAGLLTRDRIVFGGIVVLSMVGVAVVDFSQRYAFAYWGTMCLVFAVGTAIVGRPPRWRHFAHWGALALAMGVLVTVERTGRLTPDASGILVLLVSALAAFLGGIHLDWRLTGVGLALALAAVVSAFVDEFFLAVLVPAVALCALAWWLRQRFGARDPG